MNKKSNKKLVVVKDNSEIMVCNCGYLSHQIVFECDEDHKIVYLYVHMTSGNFYQRLKYVIKYLLGGDSMYNNWDLFILSEMHADKIKKILKVITKKK